MASPCPGPGGLGRRVVGRAHALSVLAGAGRARAGSPPARGGATGPPRPHHTPPAARGVRGTVADLLAAVDIALGPLDQVDQPLGATLYPGGVVRIMRISDQQVTVQEDIAFAVRLQPDANLDRSHQVVITPGEPGRTENTYFVHIVDGQEISRTLLSSQQLAAPVTEVRRCGTRTPPASAEIEAIIRDAAAAQGADAEQLLRVAYCESRFNPCAYNASG